MRKIALASCVGLVVVVQGCTLALPAGLLANATQLANGLVPKTGPAGLVTPTTSPATPPKPGTTPVVMPAPLATAPPKSGVPCPVNAKATLDQYDSNHDGQWTYAEFLPWYAAVLAVAQGCPAGASPTVVTGASGGIVSDNGGGLISNNGGFLIAQDSALLVANNATPALPLPNGGVIVNNAGPLVANNAGPLMTNNAGALIADNDSGLVGKVRLGQPGGPCFINPRLAFNKIDVNHDGSISLDELCSNPLFPAVQPPIPQPILTPMPLPISDPTLDCNTEFAKVDANQDGFVDFSEFLRYRLGNLTPAGGGGNLVSSNGGALISNNGGGLIGNNGGPIPADGNLPLLLPLRAEFNARDTNNDGQLDASEWCGTAVPVPSPIAVPSPVGPFPVLCNIQDADTDNDGFVSLNEYFSWAQSQGAATTKDVIFQQFHSADLNGDGQLNPSELCGASPQPSLAPMPSPQPVDSPQPMPNPMPTGTVPFNVSCAQLFQLFDANQDGFISYDEYVNGRWRTTSFFQAPTPAAEELIRKGFLMQAKNFDTDGDGQLSLTEFELSCPNIAVAPNAP